MGDAMNDRSNVPSFGANQMPGELAAKLLTEQTAGEPEPRYVVMRAEDVPAGAARWYVSARMDADEMAADLNRAPYLAQHPSMRATDPSALAVVDTETIASPHKLTPAVRELLTLCAEEGAEVGQASTKALRFGLRRNPYTMTTCAEKLESELGDLLAAASMLEDYGVIDFVNVLKARDAKLAQYEKNENGILQFAQVGGPDRTRLDEHGHVIEHRDSDLCSDGRCAPDCQAGEQ